MDGDSPAAVATRTLALAERMRDLSPVMQVLAVEWAQQTANSFRRQMSPAGESWPTLAPSTVRSRAAKVSGGNRRSKKTGKLTAGARRARADARARNAAHNAPGGGFVTGRVFTPLIDSGRLRQSIRYVPRRDAVELSAVGYVRYHMAGSLTVKNRPPKRNPLVVQFTANGSGVALIPAAHTRFLRALSAFVATGSIPAARGA